MGKRSGVSLIVGLLSLATPTFAQLDRCLDAHGGLTKWRSFGGAEYDLDWKTAAMERKDHQLFNLQNRSGLITGQGYTLGKNGNTVWVKPGLNALGGTPARFYIGTPLYFFGMPFVFADPGAKQTSLGKKNFQGQEYDAIKISFAKGTGDTPEDYYVAHIDPATAHLKMVYYIVTYPALRKNRPVSQLRPHAIVFDEWQTVDGLLVPKVARFYEWNGNDITGKPLGRLEFANVHFTKALPNDSKFARPPDAVIAPL
jgi:hypothetical protein